MIRNVVLHIANEQPLLADLFELPVASDAGLLCTNLRTTDGKRPVFVDQSENTFFFPYLVIRLLEIPTGAVARHQDDVVSGRGGQDNEAAARGPGFGSTLPAVIESWDGGAADLGDDIDEDFLRRIREV